MALNRGLYKSQGVNIVDHGKMSQRWLVNAAGTGINTSTNQNGQAGDATVGRGLTMVDTGGGVTFSTGRFNVTLPTGASWANVVSARVQVTHWSGAIQYTAVAEQFYQNGVTFQIWTLENNPVKSNPPASVLPALGAFTFVGGAYCGTNGTLTTVTAPVLATSGVSTTPIPGLSVTLTFGAAAPVNATAMVAGRGYTITTLGTTDFTLYGASSNTIGTSFIATGAGAGTGTTITQQITNASLVTAAADVYGLLASYAVPTTATTWTLTLPANCGGGVGVVCGSVASLATQVVTTPDPTWVSVEIDFTMSSVPA